MKFPSTLHLLLSATPVACFTISPNVGVFTELRAAPAPVAADTPSVMDGHSVVEEMEKNSMSRKTKPSQVHKEGIFSPAVYLFKDILGDDKLNKVRAKAISMHSDIIKSFVGTADSQFGGLVLRTLFKATDKNGNGQIEEEELEAGLRRLGFKWLKEQQINGIFKRAGGEEKGYITLTNGWSRLPRLSRQIWSS